MFIDTHMHITHHRFTNKPRHLVWNESKELVVENCQRETLIERLKQAGMEYGIEAAIGFDSYVDILEWVCKEPDFIKPVIGLHPNIAADTSFFVCRKVDAGVKLFADAPAKVLAIGEVGLEYYHHPRGKRHYLRQWFYFIYQIKLAHKLGLPLVLHIRNAIGEFQADRDALRILQHYKKYLHGGVVHCFNSNLFYAQEYMKLGFYLGIGGSLLFQGEAGDSLRSVIADERVPIDRIITETDSPFLLPAKEYVTGGEQLFGKQYRQVNNTSFIIPEVMRKIAELKHISEEEVVTKMLENAKKALPIIK